MPMGRCKYKHSIQSYNQREATNLSMSCEVPIALSTRQAMVPDEVEISGYTPVTSEGRCC